MARFGLLDSDDEVSDASSQHSQDDHSEQEGEGDSTINNSHSSEDGELEDAPPQTSLLSDDSHSSEDEEEEEDVMSQPSSRRSRSRSRSRSYSHLTRTPSPPTRRQQLLPPTTKQQQEPWAQTLKLEPKKVQLMQASFFGQETTTRQDSMRVREREREELEQEKEKRRRVVEEGFASRVKEGRREQASLFASTSTPAQIHQPHAIPTPVLDPAPFRPYRTYTRVPLESSTTNWKEGDLVDSGLSFGRSSRVGWGPNGEMVSLRGVYGKEKEKEKGKEGKSDTVRIEKLRLLENNEDKAAALRLLELQLSQTQIFPSSLTDPSSSSPVPFASPNPSLRFSHFVDLFNKTPTNGEEDPSNSPEAQLFKLASLLFDEIPHLGLSSSLDLSYLPSPSTYTSSITSLRRVDLLSSWLTHSLLPSISSSLHSPNLSSLEKIFLLLTTHQISQACDLALSSNNLRLATLISQIGTISSAQTDPQFQRDLSDQLSKWKEFKVDSHLSVEVRKIYELLSGNLGVSEGRKGSKEDEAKEFHVLEGREWKAAFAMGLWYSRQQTNNNSGNSDQIASSLNQYDSTCFISSSPVAPPTPAYLPSTTASTPSTPLDPIYHLLKLYTSPTHSLESFLSPLNFGPSPTDYRLPWHLYLMFSRVLRKRDFEDRLELGDEMDEEEREGNSVRADQVTISYAQQLESLGMWEWSAFVLMHLELEVPRQKAIQSLLLRNVSLLTPSITEFLTTQLEIPPLYLSLSKLTLAQSKGQIFDTYKLSLTCQLPEQAHRIAVEELCPEAVVRGDEGLCRRLLEPFREDREEEEEEDGTFRGTVEGWAEGGKIYLQYFHTLSLFSSPSTSTSSTSHAFLSSTIQSIQKFVERTRTIERIKGNKKLKMALSEMSSRLNVLSRAVGGKALNVTQPSLLGESEKLVWLQGATGSFLQGAMKRAGVV